MRSHLVGKIYRHSEGYYFLVEAIATDSVTGAEVVVYRGLYGDGFLYVRPVEMFLSEYERVKYPELDKE